MCGKLILFRSFSNRKLMPLMWIINPTVDYLNTEIFLKERISFLSSNTQNKMRKFAWILVRVILALKFRIRAQSVHGTFTEKASGSAVVWATLHERSQDFFGGNTFSKKFSNNIQIIL